MPGLELFNCLSLNRAQPLPMQDFLSHDAADIVLSGDKQHYKVLF